MPPKCKKCGSPIVIRENTRKGYFAGCSTPEKHGGSAIENPVENPVEVKEITGSIQEPPTAKKPWYSLEI